MSNGRHFDARYLVAGLAGYCTFINLYSPQAILPLLATEFGAGAAQVAGIMTAGSLSVAIAAPFAGTVSDVLGRKRVIVAALFTLSVLTVMVALSQSLSQMIVWRFIQGLAMPPVFAVTIAYIGEELSPREAATAAGIYTSGASLGGFSGRFFTGILSDLFGWRPAYFTLAVVTVIGGVIVWSMLPREKKFIRSEGLLTSARQMLRHFRNPQLVATYAVGFGVLFNFILTFTYISFRLAAPPYNMSPTMLGAIFIVYLAGSALAPLTGFAVGRVGRRGVMFVIFSLWFAGIALTLGDPLWMIVVGLTLCAGAGLLSQSVSTGYVTTTAQAGRSSAVGLYVACFNFGGGVGAALGGVAWILGGWPACAALAAAMLTVMSSIVYLFWSHAPLPPAAPSVEPP